jgi:cell division protein FtsB
LATHTQQHIKIPLIAVCIGAFLAFSGMRLSVQAVSLLQASSILKTEESRITKQCEEVKSQIKFAQSSKGIETLARKELGLVMGNEIQFRPQHLEKSEKAQDLTQASNTSTNASTQANKVTGWLNQLKRFFQK